MALKKMYWVGMISGTVILIANIILYIFIKDFNLFLFLMGVTVAAIAFPFVMGITLQSKKEQKVSDMFLEFSRNLAESVGAGTPVSKSIVNMSDKDYGPLTQNIKKLSNQISLGIPINIAMKTFADDLNNPVISRAIALMSEAERAGGEIGYILESTANSIAEVEKLKKERQAAVFNLIVQGYVIFFIFIGIMLVMEFKILPLTAGLGEVGSMGDGNIGSLGSLSPSSAPALDAAALSRPFLYLLLTQGAFAGLVIGKLSEGSIKNGIKHSFVLTTASFLISMGARVLLS